DPIERLGVRHDREQVLELAAGDHDELAPGVAQPAERHPRVVVDLAVMRERAVVVRRERVVPHWTSWGARVVPAAAGPGAHTAFLAAAARGEVGCARTDDGQASSQG